MKILGLTGGIASGKSTVSDYLSGRGAAVFDADRAAHELANPQGPLWEAYVAHFGREILLPDGTLNRRAIGQAVFHHPSEREWIDQAAHPFIRRQMEEFLTEQRDLGKDLVFLDVPLLYEVGWDAVADAVWVVYVPFSLQLFRLMARDSCDEEAARARISSQMSLEEKKRRAETVIDNSGEWKDTAAQVDAAWERLEQ